MLKQISVERYRGFAKLHADAASVTVLVGANSSGKTTILHAIRLVCESLSTVVSDPDCWPQMDDSGLITICERSVVPDPNALVALSDWTHVFLDGKVQDGASLSITLEFAAEDSLQSVQLVLAYGRNRQLLRSLHAKSTAVKGALTGISKKSWGRRSRLREELERVTPIAVFVPAFYGVIRTEEYRTQPLVTRMLGSGDQSHIVRNLVSRLDASALDRLNSRILAPLRTQVTWRTSLADADQHADLSVYFRDDNGELELASAGSGLTNLIALFAAMERLQSQRIRGENRPVMFLLDEPEAHLHPRLQGEAADALAQLAVREFGIQLVLATHSVEVINRLGRREDSILLNVDRRAVPAVTELRSESDTIEALEQFCDLTPFTSLSFLSSRRVLFYEGSSDQRMLEACARLAFRSQPDQLRRWKEYTLIPLHGVGNASAQGVLKAVLSPKLFPKLAARSVRVGLVRDRDWKREPQSARAVESPPHMTTVEVVWSRHSIENLFLDPECLSQWLAPSLSLDIGQVRPLVASAIAAADISQPLEDEAFDGRLSYHRRPNKDHQMLDEKTATQETRKEIRQSPAVFQRGHSRATFIFQKLQQSLPSEARKRLRGQLADVIHHCPIDLIQDPDLAIPVEIRALLDLLVAP